MITAPQYGFFGARRKPVPSKACAGKVRHETELLALGAAVKACHRTPLRVYPCRECHGWHLTSRVE